MPNSRQTSLIRSPSRRRATKRRRSSITEHSFHGINTSGPKAKSVTHVSGTKRHLSLRLLTTLPERECRICSSGGCVPSIPGSCRARRAAPRRSGRAWAGRERDALDYATDGLGGLVALFRAPERFREPFHLAAIDAGDVRIKVPEVGRRLAEALRRLVLERF